MVDVGWYNIGSAGGVVSAGLVGGMCFLLFGLLAA